MENDKEVPDLPRRLEIVAEAVEAGNFYVTDHKLYGECNRTDTHRLLDDEIFARAVLRWYRQILHEHLVGNGEGSSETKLPETDPLNNFSFACGTADNIVDRMPVSSFHNHSIALE